MSKALKIVLVLGVVVSMILGISAISSKKVNTLGSEIHFTQDDFKAGIKVNGVQFLSSTRGISATTATFSSTVNYLKSVIAPTADTTLTAAQSGSIVKMAVAGLDVTLPTASTAVGSNYRFVVTAAVATTNMTIVAAPADTIEGTLIVAGAVVDCDAADVITFVIDGENIGDFVELYTDGTSWLIGESGGLTASKMTCTG